MSTRTPGGDVPVRRIDRFLAVMGLGLVIVSVVCFFTAIIAPRVGVSDFSQGIWPFVVLFPYLALPLAFLLILALLIMSFVRRARANKER